MSLPKRMGIPGIVSAGVMGLPEQAMAQAKQKRKKKRPTWCCGICFMRQG